MDSKILKPRTVRIQVAKMPRIPVPKAGRVTERSIMVQRSSAINDFIKAIAIYIACIYAMVALLIKSLPRGFGLMEPALFQVLTVKVISYDISRRVVAAREDSARMYTVKVSGRGKVAFTAVAVFIAPSSAINGIFVSKFPNGTRRDIINRRNRSAIASAENRQVFRTRQHGTGIVAPILARIANNISQAIDSPVGSLHDHFGLSVAIVVKNLELRVMRTGANVFSEIDTP